MYSNLLRRVCLAVVINQETPGRWNDVTPVQFPAEQWCGKCGNKMPPNEPFFNVKNLKGGGNEKDLCLICTAKLLFVPLEVIPDTWFNNGRM